MTKELKTSQPQPTVVPLLAPWHEHLTAWENSSPRIKKLKQHEAQTKHTVKLSVQVYLLRAQEVQDPNCTQQRVSHSGIVFPTSVTRSWAPLPSQALDISFRQKHNENYSLIPTYTFPQELNCKYFWPVCEPLWGTNQIQNMVCYCTNICVIVIYMYYKHSFRTVSPRWIAHLFNPLITCLECNLEIPLW